MFLCTTVCITRPRLSQIMRALSPALRNSTTLTPDAPTADSVTVDDFSKVVSSAGGGTVGAPVTAVVVARTCVPVQHIDGATAIGSRCPVACTCSQIAVKLPPKSLLRSFTGASIPGLNAPSRTPPDTITVAVLSPGAALMFASDVVFALDRLSADPVYSASFVANTMVEVL